MGKIYRFIFNLIYKFYNPKITKLYYDSCPQLYTYNGKRIKVNVPFTIGGQTFQILPMQTNSIHKIALFEGNVEENWWRVSYFQELYVLLRDGLEIKYLK